MRTFFGLLPVFASLSALAAPTEWLDETVLADCEYCKTDAFEAERRTIANQAGPVHDPAAGMGYLVMLDEDGRFVWGLAALVGTGNLIRTDAHVLFSDTGQLKTAEGTVYFEPMRHRGASNLIEIDTSSIQRGGAVGPLEADVKNDWAIARLREDAIEKLGGNNVFAFLWDFRVTHDDIVKQGYARASLLVLSPEHTFAIHESCETVTDDHPSRYAFGVEEVFFTRCPAEYLRAGSSGGALVLLAADNTWNLGGQIVAGGFGARVRAAATESPLPAEPFGQQLFLGNVPMLEQALTIAYLQELVRRGMDPRHR